MSSMKPRYFKLDFIDENLRREREMRLVMMETAENDAITFERILLLEFIVA